jgi:predicted DNA-binding WGR domain protein
MTNKTRTLDYQDNKSSKFWEVTQTGNTVTVRYGKTGTTGQTQDKTFADAAEANKHIAKLIAEKTGKGYVERGAASSFQAGQSTLVATESEVLNAVPPKVASTKAPAKAVTASKATKAEKPKAPLQDPEATPESLLALFGKDDATNRLLAKHPRASSKLLEKLSHSSDKGTRQAVAENPNAPSKVLQKLGAQFPSQLLNNPALDWMVLENPGLFSEIPEETLTAIAKREDCPPEMLGYLAWAGHGKGLLMSLLQNGSTPAAAIAYLKNTTPEVLSERYEVSEDAVREIVSNLVPMHVTVANSMSLEQAELLMSLELAARLKGAGDDDWKLLSAADIPRKILDDVIAFELLNHWRLLPIDMPTLILEILAARDDRALSAVQKHTLCPAYLKTIKTSQDAVKLISDSPPDSIAEDELSKTESILMRLLLSEHSRCKGMWDRDQLMLEVARLPNESVLEWISQESSISEQVATEILEHAISAGYRWALYSLAENESTSRKVLEKLFLEFNSGKDFLGANICAALARNPSTPEVAIEYFFSNLKSSDRYGVAGSLAENKSTTSQGLDLLADKYGRSMYERLVGHSNASPDLLMRIAKRKDRRFFDGILKNQNASVDVLIFVAQNADSDGFDYHGWMKIFLNHRNATTEVFDALIGNKHIVDEDVIKVLSKDDRLSEGAMMKILKFKKLDAEIKKNIIRNKSVTTNVLKKLAVDGDSDVQNIAQRKLKIFEKNTQETHDV